MKKKVVIIIACMLLITNVITVLGLEGEPNNVIMTYEDPNQNYRLAVKHLDDGRIPPGPGEIPKDFIVKIPEDIQTIYNPLDKKVSSTHETIIEIIQNLNDELILGYLENITSFGPRRTGTTACQQAGEYIYNEFESYGLETRYDDWVNGGYDGNNIEGTLYGLNESSTEIYIICAHYDSVSGSPGADDDGSGTAAVLAAAYLMSQYEFNHTLRFVAFDGEEQGLLGSYRYAEEAYNNGDNIIAALNGDMIGYAENPAQASNIKIYENTASEWITDFTEDISQLYYDFIGLTIVPSGPSYGSDHASFWEFYYDSIFYHEYQFNQYYHSSEDIIENMDINYSTRVSRLITATLGELAEAQLENIPPNKPIISGPTTGREGEEITIYFNTTDPDGDDLYYLVDWGDSSASEWFGPYTSGETVEASYVFDTPAEYDIKVKAKDNKNSQSEWSDLHHIIIIENLPPNKPTISGPNFAKTGEELEFEFSTIDPEGDDVYYSINWGDDEWEFWLGPYTSGETVTFNHTYKKGGAYTIISKAKDIFDKTGQQNEFKLFILKNKATTHSILLKILEKLMVRFPILEHLLNL